MAHDPVGQGKPGRGVVELDVASEGGRPGDDDRGGEDREDGNGRRRGPRLGTQASPASPPDEAGDGDADRERRRQRRERGDRCRQDAGDDDRAQPEREQGRSRKPLPGDRLDEEPGAEAQGREQERDRDPGD